MTSMAATIDRGMDARMISVSRQLPRNSRIISAVSPAAIIPPMSTLLRAALTKIDWSKIGLIVTPVGRSRSMSGKASLMPLMTARVETPPVLRTVIRLPGRPFSADGIGLHLDIRRGHEPRREGKPSCRPIVLIGKSLIGIDGVGTVVHGDRVILVADLHVADGRMHVLLAQAH